jgi:hypothetical protein
MTNRTVVPSDYDTYLEDVYPRASKGWAEARAVDRQERQVRLAEFPHAVVLQVAFPEMDFANRWCWQQFGPAHGECFQAGSEYPACNLPSPHSHEGSWKSEFLAKTDYDFGFNEWYFKQKEDLDRFIEFVPQINWGERWQK